MCLNWIISQELFDNLTQGPNIHFPPTPPFFFVTEVIILRHSILVNADGWEEHKNHPWYVSVK